MCNTKLIGISTANAAAGHKDLYEQALSQCPCLQALRKAYPDLVIPNDDSTQSGLNDWLDNQEVMFALHISLRTLQTLRSNGTLPYSRIRNKIYYKRQDIEQIFNDNYSKKGGRK
jgi:hypothetical protein